MASVAVDASRVATLHARSLGPLVKARALRDDALGGMQSCRSKGGLDGAQLLFRIGKAARCFVCGVAQRFQRCDKVVSEFAAFSR